MYVGHFDASFDHPVDGIVYVKTCGVGSWQRSAELHSCSTPLAVPCKASIEVSSTLHFAHRDAGQEKAGTCALVSAQTANWTGKVHNSI